MAKTSSLVHAMVLIDEHFSRLKLCRKQDWKSPPGHADITPEHEALMLSEQLRELSRIDDTAKRPPDYRETLRNAEKAAQSLRHALRQTDNQFIEKSFGNLSASCSACHQRYRN